MQSIRFGLGWLFFPNNFDEFKAAYWGTKPWRIARNAPRYYSLLMKREEVDSVITSACKLDLASVEALSYEAQPVQCLGVKETRTAFNGGKTIRVVAVHRFSERLATFCRSLETELGAAVSANLYSTPARGRALRKHFDFHDLFVIQLEGRKRWRLYSPPVVPPVERAQPLGSEPPEKTRARFVQEIVLGCQRADTLSAELILGPGDLLYIPRGHVHEAEAEVISHHLAIGISTGSQEYTPRSERPGK
jgi:bifunctional lysine-specific demethylase and histidyl-hydroxylase NO66